MVLDAVHRVWVTAAIVQANRWQLAARGIPGRLRRREVLARGVANGLLLASLGEQVLVLLTQLGVLQANRAVLVARRIELLLCDGQGVVGLADLVLETGVLVDG